MKQLDLPFKIDMQYENWQFELDAADDRLNGYHSYIYIGKKLNYFLNLTTHKTELIFNADYLTAVITRITISNNIELNSMYNFLVLNTSKEILINEHRRKYILSGIVYFTIYQIQKKEIFIIYGKTRFMQKHLSKLIK